MKAAARAFSPVVIDDIGSAIESLSEFGRWVLHASAQTIRLGMTMCAASRGWTAIDHAVASRWIGERAQREHVWLVLDPLFPVNGARFYRLGVSRIASQDGWQLAVVLPASIRQAVAGATVGLIDDVSASGRTFAQVAEAVCQAGGKIVEFIVIAGSNVSRTRLESVYGQGSMSRFLPADSHAIHMRDACPGLPRSGRLVAGISPVRIGETFAEVRLPPAVVGGGLWEVAYHDRSLSRLMLDARRQLVSRFAQALGRPAVVGDLPLLGHEIPVPLCTNVLPAADMPLDRVLLPPVSLP